MIIYKKNFFIKTASIVLEDERIDDLLKSNKYDQIIALSYNKLDLPQFFSYSKPTLLIDLLKSKEDIFSTFNDTTRNEIRRTYKNSSLKFCYFKAPTEESFKLYKEFEYSQNRVPVSFKELSQCLFFGSYLDNKLVSGIYVLHTGNFLVVRSIFSCRLRVDKYRELYKIIGYATRRLVWEVCLWGKKQNCCSVDLSSVNLNNPNTINIAKFKMSFGKNLTPEYIYIYKSKRFILLERIVKIKLFLRKFLYRLKLFYDKGFSHN